MSVHSKFKSVACMSLFLWASNTGGLGGHGPPLFCIAKKKKGNKGEKMKIFETETIKRFSLSLF